MQDEASGRLYSTADLGRIFRVSDETIRRWTREGLITSQSRTLGGHRRYSEAEVERLKSKFTDPERAGHDASG